MPHQPSGCLRLISTCDLSGCRRRPAGPDRTEMVLAPYDSERRCSLPLRWQQSAVHRSALRRRPLPAASGGRADGAAVPPLPTPREEPSRAQGRQARLPPRERCVAQAAPPLRRAGMGWRERRRATCCRLIHDHPEVLLRSRYSRMRNIERQALQLPR